jgi:hypothetical protein
MGVQGSIQGRKVTRAAQGTRADQARAVSKALERRGGSALRITAGQRRSILAGVVREDGRWHRTRTVGRLVRKDDGHFQYRQVGWLRWLLRWGGR